MEPTASRVLRHFPYQHPVFGKAGASWQGSEGVKRSPYYWWWEYLRRSEKYRKTCLCGGKEGLTRLYKDFGDVYSHDFKRWWSMTDRGAKLFANERPDELVSVIAPGNKAAVNPEVATLQIPLNLPRRHIELKIKQILDKIHSGRRGVRYVKQSSAKYSISSNVNTSALETRLKIYDDRIANPKKTLWELGISNIPSLKGEVLTMRRGKAYLDPSRKNTISAMVGRYLREARKTITNVEKGLFP